MSLSCKYCGTSVGEGTKQQPTTVDDEVFCPRCFVWHRCHMEPKRFNASQTAAVFCHTCGMTTVSFTAGVRGSRFCGHCLRHGASLVRPDSSAMKEIEELGRQLREKLKSEGGGVVLG